MSFSVRRFYYENIVIDGKHLSKNPFTSDEYYSRLKAKYRGYSKVEIDSEDIISEIRDQ